MSDELFQQWRAYEKLIEHDYMDHRLFFGQLQRTLELRFKRPFTLLDLGCGDASPILPLLKALPVEAYIGIDESDVALSLASKRLQEAGIDAYLIEGEMNEALQQVDAKVDVIVASFALHHLPGCPPKISLFQKCRHILSDDGLLAVIDVFHREGESREHYLERYVEYASVHYAVLEPAEKQLLFDHVRARDYPDSLQTYQAIATAAGLPRMNVVCRDAVGMNHLVTLARA